VFYDFEITIPAGTPATAPEIVDMHLTKGVVNALHLDWPPGPRGEVNLIIRRGGHQQWPTNPSGVFNADNAYINYDENLELSDEPLTLQAVGWSPNADYDHTLHIQIGLIRPDEVEAQSGIIASLKSFLKLVGVGR
jgi:hypothetical protein